jgi:hypothetical protein
LCFAGSDGFATKDIRQHIQQHNYLLNWKGDTSSINQAIKVRFTHFADGGFERDMLKL